MMRMLTATSVVIAAMSLLGATAALRSASFDVVNAHRINIVDQNGVVRLALFNKGNEPGPVFGGKELLTKKSRLGGTRAGMFFYNDVGDEQGGLVYRGEESGNAGLLSFDPFRQNDDVDLFFSQRPGGVTEGLNFSEHASKSLLYYNDQHTAAQAFPAGPARDAKVNAIKREGFLGNDRLFAGVDKQDRSSVVLDDRQGRPRIIIRVESSGQPDIELLDAYGRVTRNWKG
jgi:hypothetical protein